VDVLPPAACFAPGPGPWVSLEGSIDTCSKISIDIFGSTDRDLQTRSLRGPDPTHPLGVPVGGGELGGVDLWSSRCVQEGGCWCMCAGCIPRPRPSSPPWTARPGVDASYESMLPVVSTEGHRIEAKRKGWETFPFIGKRGWGGCPAQTGGAVGTHPEPTLGHGTRQDEERAGGMRGLLLLAKTQGKEGGRCWNRSSQRNKGGVPDDILALQKATAHMFQSETEEKDEEQQLKDIPKPKKPGPEDCCMSNCISCVWTVYAQEMEEYKKQKAALKAKMKKKK